MKDFWDALAMAFGYDRWEWGSAADWVGAVGTAGAFLFGFLIFARDKQRQTRELADRFATWLEDGASAASKTLYSHNGASLPVVEASALLKIGDSYVRKDLSHDTATGRSVKAGASASVSLRGNDAQASEVYIRFTDGASRRWMRELRTGRYLNRWETRRIERAASVSR